MAPARGRARDHGTLSRQLAQQSHNGLGISQPSFYLYCPDICRASFDHDGFNSSVQQIGCEWCAQWGVGTVPRKSLSESRIPHLIIPKIPYLTSNMCWVSMPSTMKQAC